MPKKDPRVDAYIAKAPAYAQPILIHFRSLIHKGCPDVEEGIKWSMPAFDYKGPLSGMAAFKQHCHFNFWKARLIPGAEGYLYADKNESPSLGNIKTLKELPSDKILLGFIKAAVKLNDEGIKIEKKPAAKKTEIPMPADFGKALQKNKKAGAVYTKFSASQKREYLEWITEAKTETTRIKRMETALEWLAEGKTRHWKYQTK